MLPTAADTIKRAFAVVARSTKGVNISCLGWTTSIISKCGVVVDCTSILEVSRGIVRVLMEASDVTFRDVFRKVLFEIQLEVLQLVSSEVLHCMPVVDLVICDVATCNTVPLSIPQP